MQTVVIDLKRAMVVAVLVFCTVSLASPALGVDRIAATWSEQCTPSELTWLTGGRLGDAGAALTTPLSPGERLVVRSVAADGVLPDGTAVAVPVSIGGVAAVPGATVPGGPVVVGPSTHAEAGGLDVRSVSLLIDRCVTVASAGPVARRALPETGGASPLLVGIATACIAAGAVTRVVGRRRSPAGVREPGSPLAVRPPDRG
jgi:hypothetical protein